MRIIDYSLDQITSYAVHNNHIRTTVSHEDVAHYFRAFGKAHVHDAEDTHFLLDERLFSYYSFTIQLTTHQPYTIQQLKQRIQQKISYVTQTQYQGHILHRLYDMQVNGEPVNHILGQIGHLSFTVEVCIMQAEGVALCELLGKNRIFSQAHFSFSPRNYYTLTYLREYYSRPYALLFIEQQTTQLILVDGGWYHDVHYINIGLNVLKDCYTEHDVEKYFYTSRDEVINNPFLAKIIDEAVSFFTDMLAKWLSSYIPLQQPIMVAGDIINNPSFLPLFNDSYSAFGSSYIIPLSPVQSRKVDYTFLPKEISVASCLYYTL